MQSKKITNCAEGTEKDDVLTIKGLSIYYSKGSVLYLQSQRIKNVAAGSEPTDAVNLTQARKLVSETIDTRLNDLSSEYYRKIEDLSMGNNLITNLHHGIIGTDAVNKGQVFSLIKDCIYLKKGKLNHRVHNAGSSGFTNSNIYRIARFNRFFLTIDNPAEENTPSASTGESVPSVTNINSHPLVITLNFLINKNNRLISPQAGITHQAWIQEPVVFAEDAYYYYDHTNNYAKADYMFYFIKFQGASIVEA